MLNNLKKLLLKKNQIKLTTSILLPTIIFGFVLQSCDKNFKLFSNIKPFTEKEYIEKKDSLLKTFKNEFLKEIRDTENSIFKKYLKNIEEENRFLSSLGEENKKNIENLNNNETLEKLIVNFYNPNENVEYYTTKELKEIYLDKTKDIYKKIFTSDSLKINDDSISFLYKKKGKNTLQTDLERNHDTFTIGDYTLTLKPPVADSMSKQTIKINTIKKSGGKEKILNGNYNIVFTLDKDKTTKTVNLNIPEEVENNFEWQKDYSDKHLFWKLAYNYKKIYNGKSGKTDIKKFKGDGFVIPGQLNILKNFFFKDKILLVKKELEDNTKSLNEQLHFFKTLRKLSNLQDNKEELKIYINETKNNFDLTNFNSLMDKLFLSNVFETIKYDVNDSTKKIKLLKNDKVDQLKNLYYFINSWKTNNDISQKTDIINKLKELLLLNYFDTNDEKKDLWQKPSTKINWNIEKTSNETEKKHTSTIKDKDTIFYSSKIEVKENKNFIDEGAIKYVVNDDLSVEYYQMITEKTYIKSEHKTDSTKQLSSFYLNDTKKTKLLNENPWMSKLFKNINNIKYEENQLLKNYILLMTILKKEDASKEIFDFLKPEFENIIKSIPESILKPIVIYLLFKLDSNKNIKLTDITDNKIYKSIKDLEALKSNINLYNQELLLLLYNFLINREINVELLNTNTIDNYNSEEKLINKNKESFYQFFEFNNLWKSFYDVKLKDNDVEKIIKKIIQDNKVSFDNNINDKVDLLKLRDNGFISNFGLFNILKNFETTDNKIKLEHLTNKTKIKVYKIYYLSQLLIDKTKSNELNNKNIKEIFINVFKLKLGDPTYYEDEEKVKNFYYWYDHVLSDKQKELFKTTNDYLTENFKYGKNIQNDYIKFIISFIKDNLDKKEGLTVLLFKHLFKKTKVIITKTSVESKKENKENWKKLFNQYIKFL